MKILFYFTALLIAFASCRLKPIDIKVDPAPSKLVAFTQVIPNNFMIVTLTKSFSALEGNTTDSLQNLLVSGATVQIIFNNQTFNFYEQNPGIYISYQPAFQVNEEYELIAWYNGDTIHSTTKMLPQVNFTNVTPSVDKTTVDSLVYIDLSFADIASVDNWYLINIYKKQPTQSGADVNNYFANGDNTLAKSILVSDKEFNGTYQNKFEVKDLYHKDSIVVTLSNINQDYFNYLGFRVGGGNVFNALNIEPVTYPTNIINGYGFFNTHFPDMKYFDLSVY